VPRLARRDNTTRLRGGCCSLAFALMVLLLAVLTLLAASGLHGVQAALALATGCVAIAFTSGVGEENAITPTIFLTKSSFVQRVGDAVVACGVYR
jgi:hypothetical protein